VTVAELIERLSAFPADMRVIFTADMGHIFTDAPTLEVAPTDEGNGDYDGPDALFIDID
jgi:hypothetical protein